jgi:hypothetical protein
VDPKRKEANVATSTDLQKANKPTLPLFHCQ